LLKVLYFEFEWTAHGAIVHSGPRPGFPFSHFLYEKQLQLELQGVGGAGIRLTNGFSKKVENLQHAVALHFMFYNFCRVHQTLRVTPAMEAGLADHVWTLEELIGLIEPMAEESTLTLGTLR
jgi:hypothetical protein